MPKKALADLDSEMILSSILDPENSPLPKPYQEEALRVMQAAKLWDTFPTDRKVATLLMAKYNISYKTALRDVDLAKQLYKLENTFDYDATIIWMIKDQLELIHKCRAEGDLETWNKAKVGLKKIIGDKPETVEDPRRVESTVINIQLNSNGHTFNIPIDKLRELDPEALTDLISSTTEQITDADAEEIMNS